MGKEETKKSLAKKAFWQIVILVAIFVILLGVVPMFSFSVARIGSLLTAIGTFIVYSGKGLTAITGKFKISEKNQQKSFDANQINSLLKKREQEYNAIIPNIENETRAEFLEMRNKETDKEKRRRTM